MAIKDTIKSIIGGEKLPDGVSRSTIKEEVGITSESLPVQLIANDGVNICAEACACCWDTKIPIGYKERIEYVRKRTFTGHGSVTEHSNHVYYMEVQYDDLPELIELTTVGQYLHFVVKASVHSPGVFYVLVGGSWRGYCDLITKLPISRIAENHLLGRLMSVIYQSQPSCGYAGCKDVRRVNPEQFSDAVFDNGVYGAVKHFEIDANTEIVYSDDLDMLICNLAKNCPEPELFTPVDLLELVTCTVLFKNMSRIITQQLTRHRNAITQESQRYVNYGKGGFNSPVLFNPNYSSTEQYRVQFGKSSQWFTLQVLGEAIAGIYSQLQSKNSCTTPLKNEDARGYLPQNIQCGKIYITFTWSKLMSFFDLRLDPHAQAEIRGYANQIYDWFLDQYPTYCDYKSLVGGYYLADKIRASEDDGDDAEPYTTFYTQPCATRHSKSQSEGPSMNKESLIDVYANSIGMEEAEDSEESEDE